MKSALIVTHRRGFEADRVIDILRSRDVPVFRWNSDAGQIASQISVTIGDDGHEVTLVCDGRQLTDREVGVGWCQQLPPYFGQPAAESECLQRDNLWAASSSAFDLFAIPWLNAPDAVARASNKIRQLALARTVGLAIPQTLVSNVPASIRDFTRCRATIVKNLATPWVTTATGTRAAYTKLVSETWITNDAELAFCPVIYQTYHRRRRDYRIVVVGEQVFAASGEPGEHQQEDIRHGATGDSFSACEFDREVITKLRALMRTFAIEYCAADFLEDESGELRFLELNVCGAWWWVDRFYGGAIANAIADYLVSSF